MAILKDNYKLWIFNKMLIIKYKNFMTLVIKNLLLEQE